MCGGGGAVHSPHNGQLQSTAGQVVTVRLRFSHGGLESLGQPSAVDEPRSPSPPKNTRTAKDPRGVRNTNTGKALLKQHKSNQRKRPAFYHSTREIRPSSGNNYGIIQEAEALTE